MYFPVVAEHPLRVPVAAELFYSVTNIAFILVDDLDAMKKAGINLKTVCERMCRVFGFQIFQSGFVHADPHPGNLFVRKLPDNDVQLVLLDHGLYQYVEPAVQVGRNLT